jgi:hypothetical protein
MYLRVILIVYLNIIQRKEILLSFDLSDLILLQPGGVHIDVKKHFGRIIFNLLQHEVYVFRV